MDAIRDLKKEEIVLLKHLINLLPSKGFKIPNKAKSLNDGEMGSITFDINNNSKFGERLLEVAFTDSDDVKVYINLIVDQNGNLFEIDFWKTDFNKLITYPTPEKVNIV